MKLIVRATSSNFWWGIYGLCEKVGWEDVHIFYETGEKIGTVCINAKQYLREGLIDLKKEPEESDFIIAIENYLQENKIHYWYYFDEEQSEDFKEVSYDAPKNSKGIKPRFIEIWHPDENIGLSTIESAIKEFAMKFLGIDECQICIEDIEIFEESIKSFEKNKELFNGDNPVEINFSEELIGELARLWNISEKDVLVKLNKTIE